jgi:glucokinase
VFVLANAYYAYKKATTNKKDYVVALIGDVGGTNIRLTLRKLDLKTRTSSELKPLTKFPS